MAPRLKVSDFLAVVNQSLEMAFSGIEVEGEVSGFKVNQQKFVFFDLKDEAGTVGCFMMVWQLRMPIEDGMKVVVRAQPKVTDKGRFSLTVQEIKPIGEGALKKSFELLKSKLEKEGLFAPDRKRQLPSFPRRIGIISSTKAAGYADFVKIASERFGGVNFLVANVQVQGAAAADQMIRALEYFNQLSNPVEAVVLIRGGGSADDLAAFNDELLVRAVAASRAPVLTGIGHEIDESLCDLAADARAATPSNAAQILLPDKNQVIEKVYSQLDNVRLVIGREVDWQITKIDNDLRTMLKIWHDQTNSALDDLRARRKLIDEYDPRNVLRRGYAILTGKRQLGELIKITTKDEIMKARIEEYERR